LIKVSKFDLKAELLKNKTTHKDLYTKAFAKFSEVAIETLQREYSFLRLADLASLTFCGVETDGQAQEMGYDIRLAGARLIVSPDPYLGATIPLEVTGRELDLGSWASSADTRAAWHTARRRTVTGVAAGG